MQIPRFRMTIRGLMLIVLFVACYGGFWSYLQGWEARRVVMYLQRDVTRAIMQEARQDIAAADHSPSQFLQEGDRETYTTHWTQRLDAWEARVDRKVPLIHAEVSGANGRFSLPPITVEIFDSSLGEPWLDKLTRAYRDKGWQYRIVRRPSE